MSHPSPRKDGSAAPGSESSPVASLSELLAMADKGEQWAWDELVSRFSSLLWSVGRAHRLAENDAADVVQNTWLRLLENLGSIHNPDALPGWLATTARREALRILQRRGRDVLVRSEDLATNVADAAVDELDAALLDDERDVALWRCFRQLTERCQQLLRVLMSADRPAYAEVSAAFDMPIGSIGPTRMRCLKRLTDLVSRSDYRFDARQEGLA